MLGDGMGMDVVHFAHGIPQHRKCSVLPFGESPSVSGAESWSFAAASTTWLTGPHQLLRTAVSTAACSTCSFETTARDGLVLTAPSRLPAGGAGRRRQIIISVLPPLRASHQTKPSHQSGLSASKPSEQVGSSASIWSLAPARAPACAM